MADGQVVFEIEGDNRGIKQALRDTTNVIDSESRKWEKSGKGSSEQIGNAFTSMFKKISIAAAAAKIGQALLKIGKEALQAASDLEEVQNVVDVTFGASSKQVDKWARNAIHQYGLTETKAKQFASTIGAMMKSLGVSGDGITEMSEALAGLAADMASFYNLDFDTAFQKIRSGISGETEPLKQLGINLSVANLEAYALSKGLDKTYSTMSASEQAMLRYQYLMDATSDAQGDFARTTEGMANGTRLLESEMDQLKTTVGKPLRDAFAKAIGVVNDFLGALMPREREKTILERISEINIDKETKIAEIHEVYDWAVGLLEQIGYVEEKDPVGIVGDMATNANKIKPQSATTWETILNGFKNADFSGITGTTGEYVKKLAEGLTGIQNDQFQSKKQAWETLLGILGKNKELIASFNGQSPEQVQNWLNGLAESAKGLSEDDVAGWQALYENVLSYTGGVGLTPQQQKDIGAGLGAIKLAAKGLDATSVTNWQTFLGALQQIDGLENVFGDGDKAKQNIEDLASALSGSSVTMTKATAWSRMIDAILKSESINGLTGDELEAVKTELNDIKNAANGLDEGDVEGWNQLFTQLLTTVDGVDETEGGQRMIDALADGFGGLKDSASAAKQSLEWLSVSTGDNADEEQRLWSVLGLLAQRFPALNSYIDFNNKKILGGLPAIKDYLDYWKELEELEIAENTLADLRNTAEEKGNPSDARGAMQAAEASYRQFLRQDYQKANPGASKEEEDAYIAKMVARAAGTAYLDYKTGQDLIIPNAGAVGSRTLGSNTWMTTWATGAGLSGNDTDDFVTWYNSTPLAKGLGFSQEAGEKIPQMSITPGSNYYGMYAMYANLQEAGNNKLSEAAIAYMNAAKAYYEVYTETPALVQEIDLMGQEIQTRIETLESYGDSLTASQKDELAWLKIDKATREEIKATTQQVMESIDAMESYYQTVRAGVESTVKGLIKGFDQMETQSVKAKKAAEKLKKAEEEAQKNGGKVKKTESGTLAEASGDGVTAGSMLAGLQSQLDYMQEYQGMLAAAKSAGMSDDLLAYLADGSQASYDYLDALFDLQNGEWQLAQGADIGKLNSTFAAVKEEREKFVDDLTKTQLQIDDEWKQLVDTVTQRIGELSKYDTAYNNTWTTMKGVLDALRSGDAQLKTQVTNIEGTLSRLNKYGIFLTYNGETAGIAYSGTAGTKANGKAPKWDELNEQYGVTITPHANGLDYVPYDGYLAELHKGESVLTAEEAALYRNRANRPGFDYDNLSGAVWANAPSMGGDVYLDGRIVGRIISERQGNEYRAMERSGWRG